MLDGGGWMVESRKNWLEIIGMAKNGSPNEEKVHDKAMLRPILPVQVGGWGWLAVVGGAGRRCSGGRAGKQSFFVALADALEAAANPNICLAPPNLPYKV